MDLTGKKIAILIESDYYEHEIWYYHYRFAEEGIDARFVSKLWGQPSLTFTGHEYKVPFVCDKSFEDISDAEIRQHAAQHAALAVAAGPGNGACFLSGQRPEPRFDRHRTIAIVRAVVDLPERRLPAGHRQRSLRNPAGRLSREGEGHQRHGDRRDKGRLNVLHLDQS